LFGSYKLTSTLVLFFFTESRTSGDDDRNSDRTSIDSNSESVVSASGTGGTAAIIAQVIDTICDCFSGGEHTDDKVQVQIVKALLAAVSCSHPESMIHAGVLLKAIRTTYNIFLLSKSATTQIIAQATLTQMIQAVFGRIPKNLAVPKNQQHVGSVDALDEDLNISGNEITAVDAQSNASVAEGQINEPNEMDSL
jgi:hypothetical protein